VDVHFGEFVVGVDPVEDVEAPGLRILRSDGIEEVHILAL